MTLRRCCAVMPASKGLWAVVGFILWAGSAASVLAQEAPVADLCSVPTSDPAKPPDRKAKAKAREQMKLARAAYEKNAYTASIQELKIAYALDPSADLLYNIAQNCREAGFFAEAVKLYDRLRKSVKDPALISDCERHIIDLRPKIATLESQRATRLLEENKVPEAIAALQSAFKYEPRPEFHFRIAEAQRKSGQDEAAVASYREYLRLEPEGPFAADARKAQSFMLASREDAQALSFVEQGKYQEAIDAWDAAYKLDPRGQFLFRTADALRLAGQKKAAITAYQRFLGVSPDAAELRELRAQAEERIDELRRPPRPKLQFQPPPPPVPVHKRPWFRAVMGLSAVVVVAGGVGLGVGLYLRNKLPDSDFDPQAVRF